MQSTQRLIKPEVFVFPNFDLSDFIKSITIDQSDEVPVSGMQIVLDSAITNKIGTAQADNHILNHWLRNIKKYDIISCKINRNAKKHKFLGVISHIFEPINSRNNNTSRQLVLNCSLLMPSLLINDFIANAPQLSILPAIQKDPTLSQRAKFFTFQRGGDQNGSPFVGTPEAAIRYILDNCVATNVSFPLWGGRSASSFFPDKDVKDIDNNPVYNLKFLDSELLYNPALSQFTGSIYNYLLACIDPFYQLFFRSTSLSNGLPVNSMVLRPKPFSYGKISDLEIRKNWSRWDDLPIYKVTQDERVEENLGQNTFEIKNFFRVFFEQSIIGGPKSVLSQFGYAFPTIFIDSVKHYGLRELSVSSKLVNINKLRDDYNLQQANSTGVTIDRLAMKDGGLLDYLLDKRQKLVEYQAYPNYENGQLTLIGGDYEIGNRLFYSDKKYFDIETKKEYTGVEYYIKTTLDQYRYPETYTTTLGLTRGAPPGLAKQWLQNNLPKFVSVNNLEDSPTPTNATGFSIDDKATRDKRNAIIKNAPIIEEIK